MFASFNADVSRNLPSKTRRENIRDWVLEMFLFYPKRHEGRYKCVGCGRCVELCPAKLDLRKIVAQKRFE
jgi:ferredoxin